MKLLSRLFKCVSFRAVLLEQ